MIDEINSEAKKNTIQAQKKLNETDVKIDKIVISKAMQDKLKTIDNCYIPVINFDDSYIG